MNNINSLYFTQYQHNLINIYYIIKYMDWSYNKNRMNSVMEKLLEPPKKKKWYEYFLCDICRQNSIRRNIK